VGPGDFSLRTRWLLETDLLMANAVVNHSPRARADLREEAASAQAAADAHRQAIALLEQQLSNTESSLRKDLEQAARIHAMQLSRAEEKAAEALAAAQSDSSRGAEDLRAKEVALLASVEAQWSEREAALRWELGAALDASGKELDFVRTNVVRVLRNQLDQVESAMAREYAPLARVDEAAAREVAAKESVRELRARLGEKQSELEKLRSETVSLARFQEAEDALDKCQRELARSSSSSARACASDMVCSSSRAAASNAAPLVASSCSKRWAASWLRSRFAADSRCSAASYSCRKDSRCDSTMAMLSAPDRTACRPRPQPFFFECQPANVWRGLGVFGRSSAPPIFAVQ
jgi:chromosome segregation ATPase